MITQLADRVDCAIEEKHPRLSDENKVITAKLTHTLTLNDAPETTKVHRFEIVNGEAQYIEKSGRNSDYFDEYTDKQILRSIAEHLIRDDRVDKVVDDEVIAELKIHKLTEF